MTTNEIDESEVLELVNKVRNAWGWEPLSELPSGVPNDPCNCVLGHAWDAHIRVPTLENKNDATPDDAYAFFAFGETERTTTAAEILGLETYYGPVWSNAVEDRDDSADTWIVFPEEHPLLAWMLAFDRGEKIDLIERWWLVDALAAADLDPDELDKLPKEKVAAALRTRAGA